MTTKEALDILDIIKRIIKSEESYVDTSFGNGLGYFYIDGATPYVNEKEKELIQSWVSEVQNEEK